MKKAELSIETLIVTILIILTLVVIIVIFREQFSTAFHSFLTYFKQAIGLTDAIDTSSLQNK